MAVVMTETPPKRVVARRFTCRRCGRVIVVVRWLAGRVCLERTCRSCGTVNQVVLEGE